MLLFKVNPLYVLRTAVGVSISLLAVAAFAHLSEQVGSFLTGLALGILLGVFAQLFTLNSVTTNEEAEARESDIQNLRLS